MLLLGWNRKRLALVTRQLSSSYSSAPEPKGGGRKCLVYNVTARLVPYVEAWRWQKALTRRAMDAQRQNRSHLHPDSIIVVSHPSVFTLGRGSTLENLKFDPLSDEGRRHAIHRVERGGEVTWHGPGQVVVYPILDLTQHRKDLHWYFFVRVCNWFPFCSAHPA